MIKYGISMIDSRSDFSANSRLISISIIAALIGLLSTVAAYLLLLLISFFTNLFFFQTISVTNHSPADNHLGLWVIIAPVIGGLLIGVIARYGTEKVRGHGIPEAIEAILFGNSKMSPKVAVLKPLASGIAIGSGGPFGAEGPIIMTGGAIGSLIGQYFRITGAERKALLVAGAVAGMTAVFGTPIAAVLLAVELLLFELRPRSLLTVAVACTVAGFTRTIFMPAGPLFPLETIPVGPIDLLSCVVAGIMCGALAWVLSNSLYKFEDLFKKLPIHWMWWPALGGLAVGIGGYLEPRALGVGYDVIRDLLQNQLAIKVVFTLLICKAVMWIIALSSGTSGGVLAPLLMLGAGLGVLASPYLPGDNPALWPLVFMAATLGGMMRAPIMSVIFAFELTHDVNALLPLLAASSVAYGFTVLMMPRSILTEKIARRGHHIYREYGVDPLERHHVEEVMTHHVQSIESNVKVIEALGSYFGLEQQYRAYPVVRAGILVGMIDRETLYEHSLKLESTMVGDLFGINVPIMAIPGETCRSIATRMAVHGLERLPVVMDAHSRKLIGIISRSDLIKPSLSLFAEEHVYEKFQKYPFSSIYRRIKKPES